MGPDRRRVPETSTEVVVVGKTEDTGPFNAVVLIRLETLVVCRDTRWIARAIGPDLAGQGADLSAALDDLHTVVGSHVFLDFTAGLEPLRNCPRAPVHLQARWQLAEPQAAPRKPRIVGLGRVTIDYDVRVSA